MKDLAKRKRIMSRSIRLGHCICNPKKACPCDLFKEKDVCLCAGEKLAVPTGPVKLTQLVEKAGCASKIDRATLNEVLGTLPPIDDPQVLVGMAAGDDAGVYQIPDGPAIVQTVDVFSPSVDDPYTFGQVAAANSLSDVYAMGGKPISALSIIGFPVGEVPSDVMRDILRGGIDKMNEAGVPVIGGHSIKDGEVKAGFAVTGLIDPERMVTNDRAMPGDVLVLTKPIGVGIIAFASQIGRAPAGSVEATAKSMTMLNKAAADCMIKHSAHAGTDVTGFGLIGHLAAMASASSVDVEVTWDDIPLFDGLIECVEAEIIPGGVERNRESSGAAVTAGEGVNSRMLDVCFDPETSGGLLISIEAEKADALLADLKAAGHAEAAIIGKITGTGSGAILVKTSGKHTISEEGTQMTADKSNSECCPQPQPEEPCCSGASADEACCAEPVTEECCAQPAADEPCCAEGAPAGDDADASAKFMAFLAAAGKPGALDAFTKQAVSIALSVLSKCSPCLKTHIAKARKMGFTDEEIDEAAWMAISFGGSPVMMFYRNAMK